MYGFVNKKARKSWILTSKSVLSSQQQVKSVKPMDAPPLALIFMITEYQMNIKCNILSFILASSCIANKHTYIPNTKNH